MKNKAVDISIDPISPSFETIHINTHSMYESLLTLFHIFLLKFYAELLS